MSTDTNTESADKGSSIGTDLMASVVVFLVALPLCIGIAIASGVPPALGLVTGIVGGIIIGALAGSPLQVSGPAAGLAVLVLDFVNREGIEMLGVVVLVGGAIQAAAGFAKLGRWFRAVSPSVIQGMLSGIGVLIFANQFHVMVDDDPKGGGIKNLISIPMAIWKGINPDFGDANHHIAAGLGILTIGSLLVWTYLRPKKLKMIPGPLIAVIVATAAAYLISADVIYVSVPDNILAELNTPSLESFARLQEGSIVGMAIAIAVIASAETLLCATAVDAMHDGKRTNYDKELLAQGVGNMVCGLAGSLPATGVIVRSSANVEAGAKTRTSAIVHGIWLLGLLMLFPHILEAIPRAALAGILVYTGYKLLNIPALINLWKSGGRSEFIIFAITLGAIVGTDLLTGVMIGFGLSVAKLVYTFTHLEIDVIRNDKLKRADICLHGAATFVRLPDLAQTLEELPTKGWEAHIHIGGVAYIDHAMIEQLEAFEKRFERQGGKAFVEWDDVDLRRGGKLHLGPMTSTPAQGTDISSLVQSEQVVSSERPPSSEPPAAEDRDSEP